MPVLYCFCSWSKGGYSLIVERTRMDVRWRGNNWANMLLYSGVVPEISWEESRKKSPLHLHSTWLARTYFPAAYSPATCSWNALKHSLPSTGLPGNVLPGTSSWNAVEHSQNSCSCLVTRSIKCFDTLNQARQSLQNSKTWVHFRTGPRSMRTSTRQPSIVSNFGFS